MIALSDLVILTVSGTLLAVGIYRWQSNLPPQDGVAIVAEQRSAAPRATATGVTAEPIASQVSAPTATVPEQPVVDSTVSVGGNTAPALPDITAGSVNAPTALPDGTANTTASSANLGTGTQNDELYGSYIVESGDTLSVIAEAHGTSVESLRRINDIDGSLIYVGQQILYPLPAN